MTIKERALRRRNTNVRGYTRRGHLTAGTPPGALDAGFLRRLRQYDPKLELYWHPLAGRWVLYRMAQKKPAPSDDTLIHVSTLTTWPGTWLIRLMEKKDMMRRHPEAGTSQRAAQLDLDDIDRLDTAREDNNERVNNDNFDYARGQVAMVGRGKRVVGVKDEVKATPDRKNIIWSSKKSGNS